MRIQDESFRTDIYVPTMERVGLIGGCHMVVGAGVEKSRSPFHCPLNVVGGSGEEGVAQPRILSGIL